MDICIGFIWIQWVAVLLALAAGAYGGRITPSMMLGSTLGIVFGTVWAIAIAPISLGDVCFCGGRSILRPCTKNAYDILCIYA